MKTATMLVLLIILSGCTDTADTFPMNAAAQPEGAATPVTTAAVATPAPVQPAKGNN